MCLALGNMSYPYVYAWEVFFPPSKHSLLSRQKKNAKITKRA